MKVQRSRQRRGQVLVLVAVMAITLIALTGLSIDIGMAYRQKAQMQSACDAAAMAACIQLPDTATPSKCLSEAIRLAGLNGFTNGANNCSVTGAVSNSPTPNSYVVTLSQPYSTLFVGLVGAKTMSISCQSTAQYFALSPVSINGGGAPGQGDDVAILSVYGPWAQHQRGDMYSVKYLTSGALNPQYQSSGINFSVKVPSNYQHLAGTSQVKVDIFDPKTDIEVSPDSLLNERKSVTDAPGGVPAPYSMGNDVTQYSLFAPPPNANDISTQTPINSFQMGLTGDTSSSTAAAAAGTSNAYTGWVNPANWTVDTSTNGTGNYRVNIQSVDGAGKNDFSLRAGPPGMNWTKGQLALDTTADASGLWRDANGTGKPALSITANGRLPLAFHSPSQQTANIALGTLPAATIDYKVHVGTFDLDSSFVSLYYQDSGGHVQSNGNITAAGGGGQGYRNTTNGNDVYNEDVLTAKAGYPGGTLTAAYTNAADDSSCWQIYFEGSNPGSPGKARLVQ